MYPYSLLFLACFFVNFLIAQEPWQSDLLKIDANGQIQYQPDEDGFVLPDFSYAGYGYGEKKIPEVNTQITLSPSIGDNTTQIQTAIDRLAKYPLNSDGFRGAILLKAGTYPIAEQIHIHTSGIVLKGIGRGKNPQNNTILVDTNNQASKKPLILIGQKKQTSRSLYFYDKVQPPFKTEILNDTLPVGSQALQVQDARPFSVGDRILIHHSCTKEWLNAINYGNTDTDAPWKVGEHPIIYDRIITAIDGNTIQIDAPIFYTLIKKLAQASIYHYPSNLSIIENVGIENLRVDTRIENTQAENHTYITVLFRLVQNAWAKQCTATHFIRAGFAVEYARNVTIKYCNALNPISKIGGGRRYNFELKHGAQLILVRDCYASRGRHHYVSDGESTCSGNVFYNCISDNAYTTSEAHRHWTTGLLYDNILEINVIAPKKEILGLHNRGNFGQGHGWSCVNCVAWNYDLGIGEAVIQQPPTGQNYFIGGKGLVSTKNSFDHPQGYIEGINQKDLAPKSLYLAQLKQRLR